MKYSIVIPLYNKQKHIKQTLESIVNQTIQDFEVIIVDDGSTDSGAEIVCAFIVEKQNFTLLLQKNSGVANARNTGIANSKGDFIAFLDADDIWLSNHLAEIDYLIEKFPSAGIYSTAYNFYWQKTDKIKKATYYFLPNKKYVLITNYFFSAYQGNPVWTSVVVIPKKIIEQYGIFIDGGGFGEDVELWGRISCYETIAFSSTSTALYSQDSENRFDNPDIVKLQKFNEQKNERWWVSSIIEQWIRLPHILWRKKIWMREWIIKYELMQQGKIHSKRKIKNIFSFSFFYVYFVRLAKNLHKFFWKNRL